MWISMRQLHVALLAALCEQPLCCELRLCRKKEREDALLPALTCCCQLHLRVPYL
jgi:hypothetical protein